MWYSEEKKHIVKELLQVSKAAVACDWWTNVEHNNFLTVTLHFKMKGQIQQKVLSTKQIYDTQTDTVVAEHIGGILVEFGVRDKVVAVTLGNAFGMDIAIKKLQFRKLRCFAQTLNVTAQKVYTSNAVIRWVSKIRAVVTWIKRSSAAEKVLQEKQQLLSEYMMSYWLSFLLFGWSERIYCVSLNIRIVSFFQISHNTL